MDVSIILPTYCEKDNIGRLIDAIQKQVLQHAWQTEILVVDDNSPDGTAETVRGRLSLPGVTVTCLVRTRERGLATAINHGIHHAQGERLLVMDTDFNHSPANITRMLELLGGCDMVIGSRFVRGGGMEDRSRYVFSLVYNLFIRAVLQHGIRDSLSGFFAMRRSVLMSLPLEAIFLGYGEYFIRLTYTAHRRGMHLSEIPVFYTLRQSGTSKSRFGAMLRDYTACVLALRFGRPL
jgi:dolichol-phosphate mannosyltransferase